MLMKMKVKNVGIHFIYKFISIYKIENADSLVYQAQNIIKKSKVFDNLFSLRNKIKPIIISINKHFIFFTNKLLLWDKITNFITEESLKNENNSAAIYFYFLTRLIIAEFIPIILSD